MVFDGIQLFWGIAVRMFVTISVACISTALVMCGIVWVINRYRSSVDQPSTPQSIPDIPVPTAPPPFMLTFDVDDIPLDLGGLTQDMTQTLKTYLSNQIQEAEHALENQAHDPYAKQFLQGVIHMADKTLQQLQSIESPDQPVQPYWKQTIMKALDDMSLSTLMDDADKQALFAYAEKEQAVYPTMFNDKHRTHDFIERTILRINPEQYGIHHIGAIVLVRDDLTVGETYGGVEFLESMNEYKGRTSLIRDLDERLPNEQQPTTYTLSIDIGDHKWSKEMLTVLQNP